MKLTFNKIFFYLFVLLWSGLIICNLVTPEKGYSENENRFLAGLPNFSNEALLNGEYMNGIDEYINDQFVFRDHWISFKTMAERAMLKPDINSVYFAKDDYLIQKYDKSDISQEQAEKNKERLAEFVQKYVEKLGKDRVNVMLVPTASEILKDKLPPFATGYDQGAYMDEVIEALPEGTFIDVRNTLNQHKDEYIYYRTDHHWTALGAFYAYEQWAKDAGFTPLSQDQFDITLASDQFYGTLHSKVNVNVKPDEIYLYQIKKDMNYQLLYNLTDEKDTLFDLSKLEGKDKYSVYMGGNNALVDIKTNNKNGRRLLIMKDSYAHSFAPLAINHYEETFMIDFRYFNAGVEEFVEENQITDVLILYNTMGFVEDRNTIKFVK